MDVQRQPALSHINDHDLCVLCGRLDPWALKLTFAPDDTGAVSTRVVVHEGLQGYTGLLHGGVISALLDAAMTHCLFHAGVRAVTGELTVRFPQPIPCDAALDLRAWVTAAKPPLYRLKAEIHCDSRLMAWAEAKFLRQKFPAAGSTRPDPCRPGPRD
jgi:acyl-coenzyme A thioesterase PaaI-like protein